MSIASSHTVRIPDALRRWLDESLPRVPPASATGKALNYLRNEWDRLIRYLDDGRIEIDNNGAENAIRPFVVGRKNWLFSTSIKGVKASANLYSLIETAKANGLPGTLRLSEAGLYGTAARRHPGSDRGPAARRLRWQGRDRFPAATACGYLRCAAPAQRTSLSCLRHPCQNTI